MNKKYNKIVWNHFKTFFKIPQIIGTFSAIGILFYLLKMTLVSVVMMSIVGLIIISLFFISLFSLVQKRKKQEKKNRKKMVV
jgi:uncharacterized protein (DUF2062 family)